MADVNVVEQKVFFLAVRAFFGVSEGEGVSCRPLFFLSELWRPPRCPNARKYGWGNVGMGNSTTAGRETRGAGVGASLLRSGFGAATIFSVRRSATTAPYVSCQRARSRSYSPMIIRQ